MVSFLCYKTRNASVMKFMPVMVSLQCIVSNTKYPPLKIIWQASDPDNFKWR